MFRLPRATLLVGGIELIDREGEMPAPTVDLGGGGGEDPVAAADAVAIPCGIGMVLMDHGIWR